MRKMAPELEQLAHERGFSVHPTPAGMFWLERNGVMEFGGPGKWCAEWLSERAAQKAQ
jgi:hypothetical protein